MQMGMMGLGRMGGNMVRRLIRGGHECVVYDVNADSVRQLGNEGARGELSLRSFVAALTAPRIVWMMLPAALVDGMIAELQPLLDADDVIVDGGNSHFGDDIRRAASLRASGIHYVDVGTSGGIWGLERGYCQMIGGERAVVERLDPLFKTLAPGLAAAPATPGRTAIDAAANGYLHCGPNGAGHFVKMVHNGIEYGLMAAYAEGLNILRQANAGASERTINAETAPLRNPELYQYEFNLADITEVWRRGSVIESWLLDLTAAALVEDPTLETFNDRVSDSGEGRWTIAAAIDEGVPAHVLSAALYERFSSQGQAAFASRVLSAMRAGFGGHRGAREHK